MIARGLRHSSMHALGQASMGELSSKKSHGWRNSIPALRSGPPMRWSCTLSAGL